MVLCSVTLLLAVAGDLTCNAKEKKHIAATTTSNHRSAAVDNKAGETTEGDKSTVIDQCKSWQDFKAAVKAGKILAPDTAIPELPAGFQNGCVYSDEGAHTLNLYVLKDRLRLHTNVSEDSVEKVYRIIPQFDTEDEKWIESGKILHIGFDSGYQADERAKRYADRAHIDKESYTVVFRHLFMESRGVPLEEMARLLEATKSRANKKL